MAVTFKFVDRIDAAPTTRLNLNDGTSFRLLQDPDFSPPPMRRSVVQTMLRDGDYVSSTAYENRVVKARLLVSAATQDALATQLQLLHRELDRRANIIQFSTGETNPVFFRTFRSPEYALDMESPEPKAYVNLSIAAEPFALGVRHDIITSVTVTNNPAAGTNGMFFDVTGVLGDIPTPSFLNTGPLSGASRQTVIAVRRRGTPANHVFVRQAETFANLSSDTTLQANDPAMSGAGSNYIRTTFASAGLISRGDSQVVASSTIDSVGTYRIFLRLRKTVAADVINVQLRWGAALTIIGDKVATPSIAGPFFLDMGLIQMPPNGAPQSAGHDGRDLSLMNSQVNVYAERVSGTGSLDWDYMLIIPADQELAIANWTVAGTPAADTYMDGPNEALYTVMSTDTPFDANRRVDAATPPIPWVGSLPMLSPNQTNRLYMFWYNADTSDSGLAETRVCKVSYWPRFLYIRP